MEKHLHMAVDSKLGEMGYTPATQDADFLVAPYLGRWNKTELTPIVQKKTPK
ncbi:MAG: hypothetical protein PVJ72_03435 [Gammaproteobacteria bacterium]